METTTINGTTNGKTTKTVKTRKAVQQYEPPPECNKLVLPHLDERELLLTCEGVSELVINSMLNKDGKAALKQGGRASPEEQYNRARYVVDGHDCFKAITVKKAIMSAWEFSGVGGKMKGRVMKTVWVRGDVRSADGTEFIIIRGEPKMLPKEVRNDKGQSIMTYRPIYWPWSFGLRMTFNPRIIDDQALLQLVVAAGVYGGLGEDRPSKTGGPWGKFQVDGTQPILAQNVKV